MNLIAMTNITKFYPISPQKVLLDKCVIYETFSQYPLQILTTLLVLQQSCDITLQALRCRAAVLRCHTVALRQPQDTLRCCRGSETVTLSCCTGSEIAPQLCVRLRLRTLETKEEHVMCKTMTQHNPGFVHFRTVLRGIFCNVTTLVQIQMGVTS